MSKILVEFYWDCGRMGDLDGLFVTTKEDLAAIYGEKAYFGEVLGKYSEVSGTICENDFCIKTENQEFIALFEELIGQTGYNPFDYIQESEEDELEH